MKTIAVVSGKGGTGKTTFTAGLASLIKKPLTLVDCDVDAANLCLLFETKLQEKKDFFGSDVAEINKELCEKCGNCEENCRFDAVSFNPDSDCFEVNRISCEGCGVCTIVCPYNAVSLLRVKTGEIKLSYTDNFSIAHADLLPGCGASGLLVKEVKKEALKISDDSEVMLIDGPPGIGCPFIATLSGVDYAIIVAEPGLSSLHDLKRAKDVIDNFGAKIFVVINRYDLCTNLSKKIEDYCLDNHVPVVGKIPYDVKVFDSVRNLKPVTACDCPASKAIIDCYSYVAKETGI